MHFQPMDLPPFNGGPINDFGGQPQPIFVDPGIPMQQAPMFQNAGPKVKAPKVVVSSLSSPIPTSYEGYVLRKAPPENDRQRPSWARVEKELMSQRRVKERSAKLERNATFKMPSSLTDDQRAQIDRVLMDQRFLETNPNAEWSLADVRSFESGRTEMRRTGMVRITEHLVHVILRRQDKYNTKAPSGQSRPKLQLVRNEGGVTIVDLDCPILLKGNAKSGKSKDKGQPLPPGVVNVGPPPNDINNMPFAPGPGPMPPPQGQGFPPQQGPFFDPIFDPVMAGGLPPQGFQQPAPKKNKAANVAQFPEPFAPPPNFGMPPPKQPKVKIPKQQPNPFDQFVDVPFDQGFVDVGNGPNPRKGGKGGNAKGNMPHDDLPFPPNGGNGGGKGMSQGKRRNSPDPRRGKQYKTDVRNKVDEWRDIHDDDSFSSDYSRDDLSDFTDAETDPTDYSSSPRLRHAKLHRDRGGDRGRRDGSFGRRREDPAYRHHRKPSGSGYGYSDRGGYSDGRVDIRPYRRGRREEDRGYPERRLPIDYKPARPELHQHRFSFDRTPRALPGRREDGYGGRLGDEEAVIREALEQVRLDGIEQGRRDERRRMEPIGGGRRRDSRERYY